MGMSGLWTIFEISIHNTATVMISVLLDVPLFVNEHMGKKRLPQYVLCIELCHSWQLVYSPSLVIVGPTWLCPVMYYEGRN